MSLLMFFAVAALANAPLATDTTSAAATPVSKVEMVCRREQSTGSKRMEKICRPKAEVEAANKERDRNARVNRGLLASDRGVRPRGDVASSPR